MLSFIAQRRIISFRVFCEGSRFYSVYTFWEGSKFHSVIIWGFKVSFLYSVRVHGFIPCIRWGFTVSFQVSFEGSQFHYVYSVRVHIFIPCIPGVHIFWDIPPPGRKCQPMLFGEKNMRRGREKGGKWIRKRKKEKRNRNKGERKWEKGKRGKINAK